IIPTVKYLNSKFAYVILLLTMLATINPLIDTYYQSDFQISLMYIIYLLLFGFIIYYIEKSSEKLRNFTKGIFLRICIILYSLYQYIYYIILDYDFDAQCAFLFLIIGFIMYLLSLTPNSILKSNIKIYNYIGLLMMGCLALAFTNEYILCSLLFIEGDTPFVIYLVSLLISLLYFAFFVFNASKGSYTSLLFIIALILRYTSLSPMTFILLGIVFLVGAFLIERKKKGGNHNE
ncbi:MAG: hypothetical protein IJH34_00130, partial [Romboutsia sp.]|nr:hypothetical protein [Romboutsia sp.]